MVEDGVSLLHGVTLGGTGKERGDRHPKVRRGVLLGAGAKVLGNIEIGACAKIAAGSVVLEAVPAGCTAAGVPGAHHRLRRRAGAGTRDGPADLTSVPHPFRGLALHTWTVDTTPLDEALTAARAGGFDAVELRRRRLRALRQAWPVEPGGARPGARRRPAGQRDGRRVRLDLLEPAPSVSACLACSARRCENAVALGCGMMMSAIGPGTATTDEAVANIRRAGEIAGSFGLKLTLEYQFQHPVVRSLDILRDLIARGGDRERRPVARRLSPSARRPAGTRLRGRARRGDPLRPVQ